MKTFVNKLKANSFCSWSKIIFLCLTLSIDSHYFILFNYRMRNQFRLVVLLVFVAYVTASTTPKPPDEKLNEIVKDDEKPKVGALNPRLNKMIIMPKDNQIDVTSKAEKSSKGAKSTEKKEPKDESTTAGKKKKIAVVSLIISFIFFLYVIFSICSTQK